MARIGNVHSNDSTRRRCGDKEDIDKDRDKEIIENEASVEEKTEKASVDAIR